MIGAAVVMSGEKLANQIAVGAMNLHTAETGFLTDAGAGGEPLDDLLNFLFAQRSGCLERAFQFLAKGHG